jgi:predicted permease
MRLRRTIRLRIRSLFHRSRVEQELDAELRDHLERQIELHIAAGMSPAEARATARREFGNVSLVQEQVRDARRMNLIDDAMRDLRYASRSMRRASGHTAVAVFSLALAIGANTSIFSLLHVLMLRNLPVARPHELVEVGRSADGNVGSVSYPLYERLRDDNASFSSVLAMSRSTLRATLESSEATATGRLVSGNFFRTLGVSATSGRLFSAEDDRADAAGIATLTVIGHRLWQRGFGGDPAIVGRTLNIAGVPFTIAGVLPEGFDGLIVGRPDDFFVPMASEPRLARRSLLDAHQANWLAVVGRLKPGVSRTAATADAAVILARELENIVANSAGDDAARIRGQRLLVESAQSGLAESRQDLATPVFLLMGAVMLVLLIACANVINLLLARGLARRGELGLRLAVGASRGRLVRQLLTESALLGMIGGAAGFAIAIGGTRLIAGFITDGNPAVSLEITPDGRVLMFTAVISLLSALAAGIVPAVRAAQVNVTPGLRDDARMLAKGRAATAWTRSLIAAQVALSLVLLIGASLLVTSLRNLREFDAGFDRDVLILGLNPGAGGYSGERRLEYYRQVLERARAVPGVRSAGLSLLTPALGGGVDMSFRIDGRPRDEGAIVYVNDVSDGYLSAMGTKLLRGRDFGPQDAPGSTPVAIVNEVLARRYFKNESPIGQRVWVGNRGGVEIVGIAANAKYLSLREQDHPTIYVQAFQNPEELWGFKLAVAASGEPATAGPSIRKAVQAIAATAPVAEARTLSSQIERTLAKERLMSRILRAFAGIALLLASAGLYGVLGYAVTRRTNEIGIRLALGAERGTVLWSVLRESWTLVAIGVAIGVPAALTLTRLLSTLLYGVTPADPWVIGTAVATLFVVALAAAAQPAWRAVRVDPLVALRSE